MSQSPAKSIFETLRAWKHLRPRRWKTVPIGGFRRNPDLRQIQDSVATIYHDLGVLVFAGSSVSQTHRIGDVIQKIVEWGGPGATMSRLTGRVVNEQVQLPKSLEQYTYPKLGHETLVRYRPRRLLDYSASFLHNLLKRRLHEAYPTMGRVQIQEMSLRSNTAIVIHGTLNRLPAVLTATGLRTLPLEAFPTLDGSLSKSQVKGTVLFSAKGTGSIVSVCEIIFQIWHKPQGSNNFVRFSDDEGRVDGPDLIGVGGQRSAATYAAMLVTEEVLRPLWNLESQIWAGRVAELKNDKRQPSDKDVEVAEANAET